MKLQTLSSKQLNATLQKAMKGMTGKPQMDIMNYALIKQDENGAFRIITATAESRMAVGAPLKLIDGEYTKPVCWPIAAISALLGTLPECVVTFDMPDDKNLNIEYTTGDTSSAKTGNVTLVYQPGDEFPAPIAVGEDCKHIVLPMPVVSSAMQNTLKFTGSQELHPQINTLCIDIAQDLSQVTLVSTNGCLLCRAIHTNNPATGGSDFYRSGDAGTILVHRQYAKALSTFDGIEEITIKADDKTIDFTAGDIQFTCVAVEGRYPNYNSVIPRDNPYYVVVSKREMCNIIKRVALFGSDSFRTVSLEKQGMFLDVSAQDIDFGKSATDQVLINDAHCQDSFRISFNYISLLDCLQTLPGDEVRLQFADKSRPGIFTPNEAAPQMLTLCMPLLAD